jgi:hypothetical protein
MFVSIAAKSMMAFVFVFLEARGDGRVGGFHTCWVRLWTDDGKGGTRSKN